MSTTHRHLSPEIVTEALQSAGYRVQAAPGAAGAPVLVSATGGLPFEVRFFNPLPPAGATGAAWADAAFRAAFRVQGDLPLSLVNSWNATHRFARLLLAGDTGASNAWLILEMDVIALGGVLADNLRAHLEIWDRLIPELVAWLRAELPKLAKAAPIAEPAAPDAPQAVAPDEAAQ
ncbi:YbjN domain-containing protein [Telmatospirillum siberiense]|uniref:YbjN domain-containing protein n=1 Tax=Telmatospirillum siberiense TaxID=382514 RepID=A0A2N3PMC1_9PROT|nr:YbjN domain-containing protein [Telmatospirillum siberiense]PKU21540.1 hypothetical protein CWS72_26260 [Telmatospirillum siberiense]